MAVQSLKDLRLADAAAAELSLNPCLRCLGHYKTGFGAEGAIMCRFGADAALQDDLVQDGRHYRMCGNCVRSGQHCLEIGGEKFRGEMQGVRDAIATWIGANEDEKAEKAANVRKLALRLHSRASQ